MWPCQRTSDPGAPAPACRIVRGRFPRRKPGVVPDGLPAPWCPRPIPETPPLISPRQAGAGGAGALAPALGFASITLPAAAATEDMKGENDRKCRMYTVSARRFGGRLQARAQRAASGRERAIGPLASGSAAKTHAAVTKCAGAEATPADAPCKVIGRMKLGQAHSICSSLVLISAWRGICKTYVATAGVTTASLGPAELDLGLR